MNRARAVLRWASQNVRAYYPSLRPWLALLVVCVLFSLPDGVRDAGFRWRQIRLSGDLLALLTIGAVATRLGPRWSWVRVAAVCYAVLLFVFSLDRMLVALLMQEEPLLYDQLFMARHLFVLIGDLWNAQTAVGVAAFVAVIALVGLISRAMLRRASVLLDEPNRDRTLRVGLAIWLVALPLSVTDSLDLTKFPMVRWLSPRLADNMDKSLETYRSVARGLSGTGYAKHASVVLRRKPDVDIYVVESYGRLLWEDPALRKRHAPLLSALEKRLEPAGWHAVSAFSASPVRGARSWLADATMTVGAPIRYEAVYRHTLSQLEGRPTLVDFFHRNGYETFLVSPASRPRPGVPDTIPFPYDRYVRLDTIKYTGPVVGWGVVPDQYSLSYVEEHFVRPQARPRFMNFHLVSSHATWVRVPKRVSDYRTLNDLTGKRLSDPTENVAGALSRLLFFDRKGKDIRYNPVKASYVDGYVRTIAYDLDLLADLLVESLPEDRLVVWIGDHQPPLVSARYGSYDAPIHVLARDPALLEEFRAHGFTSGLRIPDTRPAAMGHAGMFSLLVRALSRCCGDGAPLPPFLPYGQQLLRTGASVP